MKLRIAATLIALAVSIPSSAMARDDNYVFCSWRGDDTSYKYYSSIFKADYSEDYYDFSQSFANWLENDRRTNVLRTDVLCFRNDSRRDAEYERRSKMARWERGRYRQAVLTYWSW